jgi:invasion protein IalB
VPRATSEPWGIACKALAPGKTACSLFHRQVTQQRAQIMAIEVIGISGDLPALLLTAPLGTRLNDAPILSIDGQALGAQPSWRACTSEGCLARLDDPEILGRLAAGRTLQVTLPITTETAGDITLDVPLSGFAAALKTIQDGE